MLRPFAVVFILLFGIAAWAQTTTGALVGTVTDGTGAAIPGASVTAAETATNWQTSATTNDSGGFSIPNLPPGDYTVTIEKERFRKSVWTNVTIRVNDIQRLSAEMELGQLSDTIDVTVPLPLLQTDTSGISATIDDDDLKSLPTNGRQYDSLLLRLPGVVTAAPNSHLSNRFGLNFGGLDEHYNSNFIDGIDNMDPVIRIYSYRPPIDAIQQIKIEQNGYNAEFGRNGGAVVNIATRPGTNNFHWSAWEFLRNDNFDARNFFAPSGFEKPPLIRNQFGAALGGPLNRDRTFFYVVYEGLRQKTGQVRRATVPTARMRSGDLTEIGGPVILPSQFHPVSAEVLQAYPLPNQPGISGNRVEFANKIEDGDDFSVRIDHQLFEGTRLMGRFSRNVTEVVDPFRTETTGGSNLSGFGQTADRFRTNVGLALTTNIGPNIVNELRAGFNRFRQPQIPVNPGTPLQEPMMGFLKTFLFYNFFTSDPLGSNAEFKRAVNVYNYMDSLSIVKGDHLIKVGVDVRRYLFNAYNVGPNSFFFTGARTATPSGPVPMADFLLGLPSVSISFDGSPTGNTRKFEFAGYFQDDWKATPRLTLNYGVRWEFYGRITERVNKQSIWAPDCNCMRIAGVDASEGLVDNDYNNFAPRLGFAWRPFGESTVIRGSGGIFYDNDLRHNLEFATNPPFFFVREFASPPSLSDPFPPGQSSSTLRPNTLDKKFRDTYIEHWNLSVQHEFLQRLFVQAAYVGNHSVKARRLRNINQAINGVMPYPGFAQIFLFEQASSSNYNALQLHLERRFSQYLGFTSSYTWGHATDDRPGQGYGRVPNNYDMRSERGDADFDVRHTWASTLSVNLPWGSDKPWGRWSLHAIGILQSGRPFTVTVPSQNNDRPDVVPGVDWRHPDQGPDHWINPAAFAPAAGPFGTLGRNTLRGPGLSNLDISLVKTDWIGDVRMEFRAEFFNILNHPNFSIPNAVVGPTLGVISSTASPERQIQFGVKIGR